MVPAVLALPTLLVNVPCRYHPEVDPEFNEGSIPTKEGIHNFVLEQALQHRIIHKAFITIT